jgi:hypothetical protein
VRRKLDILQATEDYIARIYHCRGVAQQLRDIRCFLKFPWANPYNTRRVFDKNPSECVFQDRAEPGTITVISSPDKTAPFVIGMYAALYPTDPFGPVDTEFARTGWFYACLTQIGVRIDAGSSLAFETGFGCGYQRGNWDVYKGLIRQFAAAHPDIAVSLYSSGL